jgi:hypothetical protein
MNQGSGLKRWEKYRLCTRFGSLSVLINNFLLEHSRAHSLQVVWDYFCNVRTELGSCDRTQSLKYLLSGHLQTKFTDI